jgi:hypothetical protein
MKVLNRPMFRYGGPIKEGIMSGIKEPRQGYRDRPSLVIKNDPMKMQIDRFLTSQNNASNASKVFENVGKTIKDNKLNNNQVSNIENIFKNNNQFGNQDPNKIKDFTIEDKIQSYTPDPENPFRNIMDYTDKLNVYVDEDGVKRNRNTGKVVIDTETIETGKASGTDMPPMLDQSGKMGAIDEVIKNKGKVDSGDNEPKVLSRKDKVNSILEGLGYDRASKNALYDAMIKAGQRISRTGLGAENLVSDVIAETSQSYDKPEKLREAANLMQVQQDLKLDQIAASKDNRPNIQKLAEYYQSDEGGGYSEDIAIRMARNLPTKISEYFTASKAATDQGKTRDATRAATEDGLFGSGTQYKGKIDVATHDSLSEFLKSDDLKTRGDGVYNVKGEAVVIKGGKVISRLVIQAQDDKKGWFTS